jgi:predicted transcriptional regulator of viral defense system
MLNSSFQRKRELLQMKHSEDLNKLPRGRLKLAAVIRAAGDVIHIDDAAKVLALSRTDAAKLLSRWVLQGWLRRVGTGVYVSVPLDSLQSEHVLEDPWVLVPALYSPAYIGGWTAAEHWGLTEQIFRDIVVLTAQIVRNKSQLRHGAYFALKHIRKDRIFGTKTAWRSRTKIAVSDIQRTLVDMLEDPALGGGIQHVADCLETYLQRSDREDAKLFNYGDRLGNGTIFKRLGYLAERSAKGQSLVAPCRDRLTKGNAKLDPGLDCPRLISRWRLWLPSSWARGGRRD